MIGIVTISFNQAVFLPETIDSVLAAGDRTKIRYVVVDAGSTDGSRELLAQRTSDLDCLICESDSGPADGLNKGFKACSECEILGYINADDRLVSGALDWVAEFFARQAQVDVLLGAVAMIDEQGQRAARRRVSDRLNLRRYAIGACNVFQQGTFIRRTALERTSGFNVENRTCWDAELVIDLALSGACFQTVHKVLGEFRIHSGSITGSGRLNDLYRADRLRIADRIRAAGYDPYANWQEAWIRTLHRASPIRQMRYLFAN